MNEEGQIVDEEIKDEPKKQEGEAGAPEGTVDEPTTSDIQSMYEDLGIKAKAPSGKPKGRPKADDSGDKKASKEDDGSGKSEQKQKDDDSKDESKTASATDKDGKDGDDSDQKSKKSSEGSGKDGKEDGEVQESDKSDEDGVRDSKSKDSEEAKETGKDDAGEGDEGAEGESDPDVKRPGKSNPEIEKRFQKLTSEVKEREQIIADLENKLKEKELAVQQTKIAQEDPEYTVEDFAKVRDEEGNIIDLDPERAELAWRRWKDGYDQRSEEREARANFEASQAEKAEAQTRQLMKDSADAYDTLAGLMDEYPELVSTSSQFDSEFAAEAMPIIEEAVQYLEGTEPGNAEGKQPVITGLKINPKRILNALKNTANKKRNLPLNGVNDNVERGSSVGVSHSRSSDPNVQAANRLYKELGINKRV